MRFLLTLLALAVGSCSPPREASSGTRTFQGPSTTLKGSPQTAGLLNAAGDPRPHVPAGALYVATGWKQSGVLERIREELASAFPGKAAPTFPEIADEAIVAYSYLEANVKFTLPYFQSREPLEFTNSSGRTTLVTSFGVRPEDEYAYSKLRCQPRTLFRTEEFDGDALEFAIDLGVVAEGGRDR